ncbi:MAG TPA: GFA family protein [Sphingobium sp.]|uniref:GFA family protein n=1 Tax=Sphingobium sp. TaxID=1912891 RepID=UPI002ED3C12F
MSGEAVTGQCHCGGVKFVAQLAGPLSDAIRCTCSACRMRGAVILFADTSGLTITQGAELLTEYRFNTGAACHYFCSRCGIYTHHQRRFDPSQYAINAACIDGLSPFDFAEVAVVDGARHPLDHGGGDLTVIGTMRFVPTDEGLGLTEYRRRNA